MEDERQVSTTIEAGSPHSVRGLCFRARHHGIFHSSSGQDKFEEGLLAENTGTVACS